MALIPLAKRGNFLHIYDFRVLPGKGEEFIEKFNKFDYSDENPFHKTPAQIKDGVLCRDTEDPDHFYLIAEWADIDEHRRIRAFVAANMKPDFVQLVEGGHAKFVPVYGEIVTETPQDILDKASA